MTPRTSAARWVCALFLLTATACEVAVPSREPCEADRDCARGSRCVAGRCEEYPRSVGASCDTGVDCLSAFCHAGSCRTPCQDGSCRSDEFCQEGACLPRPRPGEACTAPTCLGDAQCTGGYCRRPCVGADDSPCEPSQFCDASLCTRAQQPGQACSRSRVCLSAHCVEEQCRGSCASGRDEDCAASESCEVGVCVPRLPSGRGCVRDSQCVSGGCRAGVCSTVACAGADDGPCPTHEFCDGAQCRSQQPAEASCERERMCASGLCVEGRCRGKCTENDDSLCGRSEYCSVSVCTPTRGDAAPCDRDAQCESALCAGGKCRARCLGTDDALCTSGEYCGGLQCLPALATGEACSRPRQCDGAHCLAAQCRAGCTGLDDAVCAPSERCTGSVCAPKLDRGTACARDGDCTSGVCDSGLCRAACAAQRDLDCARGEYCNASRCTPTLQSAATCVRGGQCDSGYCTEGACRAACMGTLDPTCTAAEYCDGLRCAPRLSSASPCTRDATCQSLHCVSLLCRPACSGIDDHPCDAGDYCNGLSCAPRKAVGATCVRTSECQSGACDAGRCRAACTGADDTPCAGAEFCDGSKCIDRSGNALSCSRDRVCSSGLCVEGVCCNERCSTCKRCDVVRGRCELAPGGAAESRCPATSSASCGLSGACDGAGRCALYDTTTSCQTPTCAGSSYSTGGSCSGTGVCLSVPSVPCAPFACGVSACRTSCVDAYHCAPGYACESGACRALRVGLVAGGGAGDGSLATLANLKRPVKLAVVESPTRYLYIADEAAHRIRRVHLATGLISTVAGTGVSGLALDGARADVSRISSPEGLALSATGELYFAELGNHLVRKLDTAGLLVTLIGTGVAGWNGDGSPGLDTAIDSPRGLVFDSYGALIFSDSGNHRVRKLSGGAVMTLVGLGFAGDLGDNISGTLTAISTPDGLSFSSGGELLFADAATNRVRKLKSSGTVVTVAGTGFAGFGGDGFDAEQALLNSAAGVTWWGSNLLIADTDNNRIRATSGGNLLTLAGTGPRGYSGDGQAATTAQLAGPHDIIVDAQGNRYIADTGNHRVRRIDTGGVITTVAGSGQWGFSGDGFPATSASLGTSLSLAFAPSGDLYVAQADPPVIRRISGGVITTVAGTAVLGPACSGDGVSALSARLGRPSALVVIGSDVYIADRACHAVRKLTGGILTTVAGTLGVAGFSGDGAAATAGKLDSPTALVADALGRLYIADTGNHRVRRLQSGTLSTFAGNGGASFAGEGVAATTAAVPGPRALAVSGSGDLYVSDQSGRVRRVAGTDGRITTFAGSGLSTYDADGRPASQAALGLVTGLASDARGDLYLTLPDNLRVVVVSAQDGRVYTVAGNGQSGVPGEDVVARSSPLVGPRAAAVHPTDGRIYFVDGPELADSPESRIRRLQ